MVSLLRIRTILFIREACTVREPCLNLIFAVSHHAGLFLQFKTVDAHLIIAVTGFDSRRPSSVHAQPSSRLFYMHKIIWWGGGRRSYRAQQRDANMSKTIWPQFRRNVFGTFTKYAMHSLSLNTFLPNLRQPPDSRRAPHSPNRGVWRKKKKL